MDDVTLIVKKDVAVVPIFDLKIEDVMWILDWKTFHLNEIGDNAIGGTTLHKVSLCGQKLFRVNLTKLLQEIVKQRHPAVFLDLKVKSNVVTTDCEPLSIPGAMTRCSRWAQ